MPRVASSLLTGVKSPEIQQAEQEVEQARRALDGFQARLGDTDRLLGLSTRRRVHACSNNIGQAMWSQKAKFHSGVAAHLCLFSMAGLGCWAMFSGMNPIVGLAGGVGLTYGYIMAMKHVVLPIQCDRKIKPALQQEQKDLTAAVQQSRQRLETAEQSLLQGINASLRGTQAPIQVSEAAVTVGGVRIKVRK